MSDINSSKDITAFLLPIDPDKLLLPNTSIAEVISVATMIPVAKKPNWFLGKLGWHGRTLPIISFGRIDSKVDKLGQFRHAAIIRGGNFPEELPVFAIALSEPPRMMRLTRADMITVEEEVGLATQAIVEVAGHRAIIPNIAYIEKMLIEELV
mgnify:CR=1 FL=1